MHNMVLSDEGDIWQAFRKVRSDLSDLHPLVARSENDEVSAVGIGPNKKTITRAAHLALAAVVATRTGPSYTFTSRQHRLHFWAPLQCWCQSHCWCQW